MFDVDAREAETSRDAQSPDGSQWLTVEQAAKALGVARSTLYRWEREGRLKFYRFGPRVVRIHAADLAALGGADAQTVAGGDGRSERGLATAVRDAARAIACAITRHELLRGALRGLEPAFRPRAAAIVSCVGSDASVLLALPRNWMWADPKADEIFKWPFVRAVAQAVDEASRNRLGRAVWRQAAADWSCTRLNTDAPLELRQREPGRVLVSASRAGVASGVVAVADPQRDLSDDEANHLLELWTSLLSEAGQRVARLAEYERLAFVDPLTELPNRRRFERALADEVERRARYGRPVSLLVMDIDHFKEVNDRFGHLAGDEVLRAVADWLRQNLRSTDLVARIGGDEFAVICPETSGEQARVIAERIAAGISRLPGPDGKPISATVGVAEARAGMAPRQLYERADMALYRARELGRRVYVDGEAESIGPEVVEDGAEAGADA